MNTSPETLPENEFSLIREITRDPAQTQRELSHNVGISLGMTNLLLKRLIKKGYIKVKQLDWNKTQYLLTIKGMMEKTRKSYAYAIYAWRQTRKITQAIQETVTAEYRQGARRAVVVAWPETADLIREALADKDFAGLDVSYIDGFKYLDSNERLVFVATVELIPDPAPGQRFIPLLEKVDLEFKFAG